VDDEPQNIRVLEAMLESHGCVILTAATGEDALALLAAQPPDLILLDVMMAGMDGYEVAGTIKRDPATSHIPIIMVTALDDRDAKLRGLSAGAEDFLSKPVDRAELCVRVRNLLRLKAYGDYYDQYTQVLEADVAARTAERTKTLEEHAAALRKNEERTNYALGAARMGVWDLDMVTQQLTWSATMAPLFGLTSEQVPTNGTAYLALIHPNDRQMVADSIARAAATGIGYDVEFRVRWPDGTTHWLASRDRMERDANDQPVRLHGIETDISDRKSLEAQFRQAQKMEAVGQLAGGVAHDFNNLLTAILGYSNFVIDGFEPDDPRRSDMDEIVKAGQRAAALTKQLLAFSRKQVLQPTTLDLNALVTGMRHMLGRLIGEHVDLVPVLAPDLAPVRADPGHLEQVLMNLVVNARDAMPAGGRLTVETANVELDHSFLGDAPIHPGSYVMLAVSDTGIGMTEDTKRRLFEPFFTTKEIGKGTGLGLATVYGIVKQSGGYVWVYSEPGKGATFKVFLPRAVGAAVTEQRVLSAKTTPVPTETVLVVEDEAAVRLLTCRILQRAGYRVFDAPNPQQAAALFDQHTSSIQLLVTDVIMPGSTGPQLFERLARQRPDLKVLYVSGYTDDTIMHQGQLDPGVVFLQKPFTADALNRRVRDVLDR
jgi:PAS domain S-box-containing protein